jgi:F-type H+-transporting ATPase subunit a
MTGTDTQAAVQEYIQHHTMTNPHSWAPISLAHPPSWMNLPLPAPFSLHALMLLLCAAFLLVVFGVIYRKDNRAPHGLTNCLEIFILFIRDHVAIPSLGAADGRRFTPYLCSLFFFILGLNAMGLIPLFTSPTANINVTAALALATLAIMVGGGIYRNGPVGFIKTLLPSGVPWPILILLFPIEIVGMFIKPFALTLRLFANMLAGHIVIFSLLSLAVTFGLKAAAPAVAMATGIYFIEILVVFLQAFIFTLLSAMFIGSFLHPAH